jgi:hypothetical protein
MMLRITADQIKTILLSIAQGTDIFIDTNAEDLVKLGKGLIRFSEAVQAFDAQKKK